MRLKGKPHDLSIYFKDPSGAVNFACPKGLGCQSTLELRVYGDLLFEGIWDIKLTICSSDIESPIYTIHFDDILKEINRRMEIIEDTRINRPE